MGRAGDAPWENASLDSSGARVAGQGSLPLILSALIQAFESSIAQPLQVTTARTFAQKYAGFVSLAGWLQVGVGRRPIALPQREAGKLLCVEQRTVSRYAKWAEEDGFLRRIAGPVRRGGQEGPAPEYLFDVSRFP